MAHSISYCGAATYLELGANRKCPAHSTRFEFDPQLASAGLTRIITISERSLSIFLNQTAAGRRKPLTSLDMA
jgi:hypothetical protein